MKKIIRELIKKLSDKLNKKHWSLVTAESCSGGGLSHYISQIPGCSSMLERGYVVYSEIAKQELLSVKAETLERYGAVSEATAIEMAEGALRASHAQVCLSITGLAGPNGDKTSDKPIGTIYMACASVNQPTQVVKKKFSGNRSQVCNHTITDALKFLLHYIA